MTDAAAHPPLSFAATAIGRRARRAVGELGDAIRVDVAGSWSRSLMAGDPVDRSTFTAAVPGALDPLVAAGLATVAAEQVTLAITIIAAGPVLAVIPKRTWGDEIVYLGPDSAHLAEAALRLAPRGACAADLGTGTGLLAALLAQRYSTVVATDVAPSVVAAAELTLALNRHPDAHHAAVAVADVAGGLRPEAFDLVAANAPWVPLDDAVDDPDAPRELFAHGGHDGFELPQRFIRDGATLLRPGGVAITLALDVTLTEDGSGRGLGDDPGAADRASAPAGAPAVAERRPLGELLTELETDGFVVAVLPTPFNRERPQLVDVVRSRQPRIRAATHVAVVVARPRHPGDGRGALRVAVDALRVRWANRPVAPAASTAAAG